MSDEHAQCISPSLQIAASDAFAHAVTGVGTRCRQLAQAIDDHDFERVMDLGARATDLWLQARAACRRLLDEIKPASPYAAAAREHLERNYMALLAMFVRANEVIAVPRMTNHLGALRDKLMKKMAEPLARRLGRGTGDADGGNRAARRAASGDSC